MGKSNSTVNTMDYPLVLKGDEGLAPAVTWTNLENIMLSERNQTQKDTYYEATYVKCPEWGNTE
jgi:hypothetical protein